MNKKNILIAQILTYSGILPFLLLAIAIILKAPGFEYDHALRVYASIIVSFLCGIHWAIYLFFSDKCPCNLFLYSNAIALIAFACLLFGTYHMDFIIQSFCFIFLLRLDHKLSDQHILPKWFFSLRCKATFAVVVILVSVISLS